MVSEEAVVGGCSSSMSIIEVLSYMFHNMSLKVQARHLLLLTFTFMLSMFFFDTDDSWWLISCTDWFSDPSKPHLLISFHISVKETHWTHLHSVIPSLSSVITQQCSSHMPALISILITFRRLHTAEINLIALLLKDEMLYDGFS